MKNSRLEDINNELKVSINEASFISNKVLKKMILLVCKYFYVNLPVDDFLRVNIELLENGNVLMKDEEYITSNKPKDINELYERYDDLKKEIDSLLDKKEISFDKKRQKNDIISFFIALILSIVLVLIAIYSFKQIIYGNIIGGIWLFVFIIPLVTTKIKDRYSGAIRFLKNIFKKK